MALKDEEYDSDGYVTLIVKNIKRFVKNEKWKEEQEKDKKKTHFIPTYYNYGKKWHIKPYCHLFKKANKKSRKTHKKKACVTWKDNDMYSLDDEEEKANNYLTLDHQNNEVTFHFSNQELFRLCKKINKRNKHTRANYFYIYGYYLFSWIQKKKTLKKKYNSLEKIKYILFKTFPLLKKMMNLTSVITAMI